MLIPPLRLDIFLKPVVQRDFFFFFWGRGCFGIRKRISFNPSKAKALCDKEIGTKFLYGSVQKDTSAMT